jgi:hypothetical protein
MKAKVNKIPPEILAIRIVEMLDRYKSTKPNAEIAVETPDKTVTCKLADALIYTDDFNNIIIDSE